MIVVLFVLQYGISSQIARFMGPTWGPPGSCRSQMGPILSLWALLSGIDPDIKPACLSWWRHDMKTLSVLLVLCHQEDSQHKGLVMQSLMLPLLLTWIIFEQTVMLLMKRDAIVFICRHAVNNVSEISDWYSTFRNNIPGLLYRYVY